MPRIATALLVVVFSARRAASDNYPVSSQQSKTLHTHYTRYEFSHPTHTNWWALCSNRCVNGGQACGLLLVHHGIYSNPGDMEWLMLRARQEEAFQNEGDHRFCIAFVKSKNVAWEYSACNEDVDFAVDVVDTCIRHEEMRVDALRVAMHGFSSGGIFSLHNSNAFSKLGSRVKSFVIYGSNNIAPQCNFMQGHLLMVHGEQDRVVKWGSVHESEWSTCGTRKIITRVATLRGYSVTPIEVDCAENCDRYYHCFAERSKVAPQTWDGIKKYFGDCGSGGDFLESACNIEAVLQCAKCYPESPCSTYTAQPSTGATTSSLKLTNLDGGDDTTVFQWGGGGADCEGVVEHWRIRDWNHDYPNRQENGESTRESAFWARMRKWLWSNSGHAPSGCTYDARYQPNRPPPSCGTLCVTQSQMDWCASASAGYGIGTQTCATWGTDSLCKYLYLGNAASACCSNAISPTTSSSQPSSQPQSPSSASTPVPVSPAPTTSPPSLCLPPETLKPLPDAGYSCTGVGGIDSNFGGTSTACSIAGGSWVAYTCQTAFDYWHTLPEDDTSSALKQVWEPKCCAKSSETPTSLCSLPNALNPPLVAGYSCTGVEGMDSNFGGTSTACTSAGGSWVAYTCQTASDYWLMLPKDATSSALKQVWEPKCCVQSSPASPPTPMAPPIQPTPTPALLGNCPSQCMTPKCHWSGVNGPGWDSTWSSDAPDDKPTENGICKFWCMNYTSSHDALAGSDKYLCGDGAWHKSGVDCRLCTDQGHPGTDPSKPISRCNQPGANNAPSIVSHRSWGTGIRLCTTGPAASNIERCTVYQALNGDSVVNPERTCRGFCQYFGLSCANGWDDDGDGCTYGGPGIGCDNALGVGSVDGPTPDHICQCIDRPHEVTPQSSLPSPPIPTPTASAPTLQQATGAPTFLEPHPTPSPSMRPTLPPTVAALAPRPPPTPWPPTPAPPPMVYTIAPSTPSPFASTPWPPRGAFAPPTQAPQTPLPPPLEPEIHYQLTIRNISYEQLMGDRVKIWSITQSIKKANARKLNIVSKMVEVVLSKGSVKADVTIKSKPSEHSSYEMDHVAVAETLKAAVEEVKEEIVQDVSAIPNISDVADGKITAEVTTQVGIFTATPTPVPTQAPPTLSRQLPSPAPTQSPTPTTIIVPTLEPTINRTEDRLMQGTGTASSASELSEVLVFIAAVAALLVHMQE